MKPPLATHQAVRSSSTPTSTSPRSSDRISLTALHVAVIDNDREKVRALLAGKENAVDERTTTGATAVMLASLYGRFDIFIHLLKKSASILKQDYEGFGCKEYVRHLAFTKPLLRQFEVITVEQPRRSGRKAIYDFLRSLSSVINQSPLGSGVIDFHPGLGEQWLGSDRTDTRPTLSEQTERRIISLRKGGVLEIVGVESLARAEFARDLARKTCGAVRGQGETVYRAVALSGWRGDEAQQSVTCLNNAKYLELTRAFANIVGYRFKRHWLDNRFQGDKAGAFHACHCEKQLVIFILRESLGHVLGARDITLDKMAKLKLAVDGGLGDFQRKFIIDLEHKPCKCCIAFLKLIYEKSGLYFEWVQREWFSEGMRAKLKPHDGVRAPLRDPDASEDEIDGGGSEWELVASPGVITLTAPITPNDDWVLVGAPRPFRPQARCPKRGHEMPMKAGSEVGPEDWPIPARKNVPKRLSLVTSRERKQERFACQQLPRIHDTPCAASSSQPAENCISSATEPFPGVSRFMLEWASSGGSEEMD